MFFFQMLLLLHVKSIIIIMFHHQSSYSLILKIYLWVISSLSHELTEVNSMLETSKATSITRSRNPNSFPHVVPCKVHSIISPKFCDQKTHLWLEHFPTVFQTYLNSMSAISHACFLLLSSIQIVLMVCTVVISQILPKTYLLNFLVCFPNKYFKTTN